MLTQQDFLGEWIDEITDEASSKLEHEDNIEKVYDYLYEMAKQGERVNDISFDIIFKRLICELILDRESIIDNYRYGGI